MRLACSDRLLTRSRVPSDKGLPDSGTVSRQQRFHHLAADVGQAEIAALETIGQPLVIEAEEVQERGLEVVDVHGIFGDVVAKIVRLAEGDAALDAAAGQPDRIATRVMVAA